MTIIKIISNYNADIVMNELMNAVTEGYNSAHNSGSTFLRQVTDEFDFTHLKARKLLINAGVYHTDISDEVTGVETVQKTSALFFGNLYVSAKFESDRTLA